MKKHFGVLAVLAIFAMAGYLRFFNIAQSPGYEWDEPVYAAIAQRTIELGYPNLKGDGNVYNTEPYLYHPPFDFYLKALWLQNVEASGIVAGRILSSIEAMIGLAIAYFCLKDISGRKAAVIGLILLATDGWLVYTNRLNLIENAMMLLGVFGIWMYIKATKSRKTSYYLAAGFFLAFAAIYKHTGLPFLAVPIINFMITRKDWKQHIILIQTMAIVVLIYMATMWAVWGSVFTFQTWVQIARAFGNIGSRGLNYGFSDAISAVTQTYWVFFVTIAALAGVGLTITFRILQVAFRRKQLFNSVLLSWAIAAFFFLVVIALKAPHYLITALVPGYIFISSEIGNLLEKIEDKIKIGRGNVQLEMGKKTLIAGLVALAIVVNLFTWTSRFAQNHSNALLETYSFFETVSVTARVMADDCIGVAIQQPYFGLDRHASEEGIKYANPDYVALYTSQTQQIPDDPALRSLLSNSTLIRRFSGFKEVIEVYQVNGGP
jgi:4-amino-4-deoxy-L-arabinose transferase-like glycosyltransferase